MELSLLTFIDIVGLQYIGKPWTVIGRAASLYTDPFIMLSGLLTTYSFIGRLNKSGRLDVKNEYISRLFRYTYNLIRLCVYAYFR